MTILPPKSNFSPLTIPEARDKSVAGTQISASNKQPKSERIPVAMACNSLRDSPIPFIFQFPAIKGRIFGVMSLPQELLKKIIALSTKL